MEYWARVTPEGDRFLIDFPAAPGCQTFAEANEDVYVVAQEAIEGWLEAHLVEGEAPPKPAAGRPEMPGMMIPVHIAPTLGVRLAIRWTRQELGLSQARLAKKVGVSRQQISLIESPDANLTLSTLDKIAGGLGLQVDIELQARVSPAAPSRLAALGGTEPELKRPSRRRSLTPR
jgi:DNA-binding XRE family transcriptional regulator/predicted RNase H-like HicB family nuclease